MAKYSPKTRSELRELVDDESVNLGDIDTSAITDMSYLFNGSDRKDFSGIEKWDTSKVKTMESMFQGSHFNHNINDWDVSNVENMESMFDDTPFNQPLDKWNVSKVTNMGCMFEESPFNQPLNDWNVSSVTNMGCMFRQTPFNQPLDKWNVSKVTDMGRMFEESLFNQPLNDWDTSSVENMGEMFLDNTHFNQPLDKWNTANVKNMSEMFQRASSFTQSIESWDVSSLSDDNVYRIFDDLSLLQQKELKLPSWWLKNFSKPKDFKDLSVIDASVICEQLKVAYLVERDKNLNIEKVIKKYPNKLAAMVELKKEPRWNAAIGYNPNKIGIDDLKFLIGMKKDDCDTLCKNSLLAIVATIKDDKVSVILGVYDTILDALEAMPYKKENACLGYQPETMKANEVVGKSFVAVQKAMETIVAESDYYGYGIVSYWWVEVNDKGIITKIAKAIERGDERDRDEMRAYKDDLPKADNGCHFELIEIVFAYKVNQDLIGFQMSCEFWLNLRKN